MKFSQKNFENWWFWKMHFFWVGHFEIFFPKKNFFFAFFPWKLVKVYWLARMAQNFDQAKRDNTFWPMPNILKGSVSITLESQIIQDHPGQSIIKYINQYLNKFWKFKNCLWLSACFKSYIICLMTLDLVKK